MRASGDGLGEIAEALGRSKSTISREVRRNSSPSYRLYLSHRAHERAVKRKKESGKRPRLKNGLTVSYVRTRLELGWSPEQIAGRIGIDHPGLSISKDRREGREEPCRLEHACGEKERASVPYEA